MEENKVNSKDLFNSIKVVLVGTTHPGNIGASARAMKNMGLLNLALVTPKEFPSDAATYRSKAAKDVLENAQVFENLKDAVADCELVIGTSARDRKVPWPVLNPKESAEEVAKSTQHHQIAIVFGREDRGLSNNELLFAHKILNIKTSQNYPSLNLSHAVSIILYELNKSSTNNVEKDLQVFDLASSKQIYESFKEIEEMLIKTGYLLEHTANSKISKFKKFLLKAKTSSHDINVLRGIVHQINWFLNNSKGK